MDLLQKVMNATQALVRIRDVDAGVLSMLATDDYQFAYHPDYLNRQPEPPPLSLTMPLSPKPYRSQNGLPSFFDNLLFEGEQLRLAEKKYGLHRQSVVDRFKLLLLSGRQTLSYVSILPIVDGVPQVLEETAPPPELVRNYRLMPAYSGCCSICLKPHPSGDHAKCQQRLWGTQRAIHLEAYVDEPLNTFRTVLQGQSISGGQRKALFSLNSEKVLQRIGFPHYIIKPDGDYPEMPPNEHLTMAAAHALGFRTPPVGLYHCDEVGYVCVIKRFDWTPETGFQLTEDLAQLSDELEEHKDRSTMEQVAGVIRQYSSSPALELAEFFRRLIFCFLCGNGDMHLKNWSLCRDAHTGLVKLAPIYDYLSVRTSFPQEKVEMILSLDGKHLQLTHNDFRSFARTIGLADGAVNACMAAIPQWTRVLLEFCQRSALSQKFKERYRAVVTERASRLISP